MERYMSILTFVYLAVVFFATNWLSKKAIVANWGAFWTKRVFLIPLGLIICALYIALISWLLPANVFLFAATPVLFYFIGLVAHATFTKVKEYQDLADKHSGYGSSKKKNK